MELALQKSLEELKDALTNDPRIKTLSILEKRLYEDPALLEIVKKKDDIERQYNLVLSYKDKDDEEAKIIGSIFISYYCFDKKRGCLLIIQIMNY